MYEEQTIAKIKRDIMKALEEAGTTLQTREGSFSDDMAGPQAVELHKMYAALNAVIPIVWVDETSGPYLDMAAEDLAMEPRKAGSLATVTLCIEGTPGFVIKAGARFGTASGLYFSTLKEAEIPEGGVLEVEAQALSIGIQYNVGAGAILRPFVNQSGIEKVVNPAPSVGGTDVESDKSLYLRIVQERQKPSTSGNRYHYEKWAGEVPGVGAVRVFPLWNGNGTVKVLIADENRNPVDAGVVAACAAHIEEVRPIGASVTVVSATAFPVSIAARLMLMEGASLWQIKEDFTKAVAAYFAKMSLYEYQIKQSKMGALFMETEGVLDYANLLINGNESNVPMTREQVPVLGEVTLTV